MAPITIASTTQGVRKMATKGLRSESAAAIKEVLNTTFISFYETRGVNRGFFVAGLRAGTHCLLVEFHF